ncbi:MAG: HRDC domain-containing protein [Nocardioides sp.]
MSETPTEPDPSAAAPELPWLELREPIRAVVESEEALLEAAAAIAAGSGPLAIDAERASGYRYSGRAYLIQIRREGAGSWLIDPTAVASMAPIREAFGDAEWIVHAATQDLPCLAELDLHPVALFDTELAGRLLGYPRVGLATLVEELLGQRLRKEHSAADWSTRPLPAPWLDYAALDVEVLLELRDLLDAELVTTGKRDYAAQEFTALLSFEPTVRVEAWRRTSGMHRIRTRRGLGAVRALWTTRDEIARERDVTPGRIIPDSAIVAAASAMPLQAEQLMATSGFHGRGARRYLQDWVRALREVAAADEDDLPSRAPAVSGPPPPRAWADKDPVAAKRLQIAREALAQLSEEIAIPAENLLTPDYVRRLMWEPPEVTDPAELRQVIAARLEESGAREWQRSLTTELLAVAIETAETG